MKRLLGLAVAACLAGSARAGDAESEAAVPDYEAAVRLAETLARRPYAPPAELPRNLKKLSYDDLRAIRFHPREAVWRMERLPFQLQFFHPGGLQKDRVAVSLVEGDVVSPVPFGRAMFEYADVELGGRIPDDVGFSGFRVHYPLNRPDYLDELIVFQGATYFRALPRGAVYGTSARALGLRIAEGAREEFPRFRQFWVERPDRAAACLRLWGVFDSESAAGAAEFRVEPGVQTRVAVRVTAFLRRDVPELGLAPLTSMFWYGENGAHRFGDFRPEVHDADGALIHTGAGEWLWRPLMNETNRFRWSAFRDAGVRGFGLLQRDRQFASYEDLEALYHRRPSVWVEPGTNGWGPGEVRLVELPTICEYGDNVNLFFVPPGPARAGARVAWDYRLHWFLEDPAWPPLGRTVSTRLAAISYNRRAARFVIEFSRPPGAPEPEPADVRVDLSVDRARLLGSFLQRNDIAHTWRVFFDVEAASSALPAELRCTLRTAEGPLTETWAYQWMHPAN